MCIDIGDNMMKAIGILCIIALMTTSASAAYVTPTKDNITQAMLDYDLNGENNTYESACEIGQYFSDTYHINVDIREVTFENHTPVYLDIFYPAANNSKGHDAYYGWFGPQKKEVTGFWGKDGKMLYRDWGSSKKFTCYIPGVCSYQIVKSYFGNVPEENTTAPIIIDDPIEETTRPDTSEPAYTEPLGAQNNAFVNTGNQTDNNITVITASGNLTSGENSTGTVNNQGVIDTIKQYFFDFKNANLSNVSFNFWG